MFGIVCGISRSSSCGVIERKSKLDQKSVTFTKDGDIGTNPEMETATETTGNHCEGPENEHQETESCSEDREEDRQGKRMTTRYVHLFLSLIHW